MREVHFVWFCVYCEASNVLYRIPALPSLALLSGQAPSCSCRPNREQVMFDGPATQQLMPVKLMDCQMLDSDVMSFGDLLLLKII